MVEEYYLVHRGLDAYVYTHPDRAVEKFVMEASGIVGFPLWKVWLETRKEGFQDMIPVKLIKEQVENK